LDLIGLGLLLKKMEPTKEIIHDVVERERWLQIVHHYRPAVERTLDVCLTGNESKVTCSSRAYKQISQYRYNHLKYMIVYLLYARMKSIQVDNELE